MCTNFNKIRCVKLQKIPKLLFARFIHNVSPELNYNYICNPQNSTNISENVTRRKGVGNISNVLNLHEKLIKTEETDKSYNLIKEKFISEALKIPNECHKDITNYDKPKLLKFVGRKREFSFKPKEFHELTKNLNIMRTTQLGNVAGTRSYYFYSALAELEQTLIRFTITKLLNRGFTLISVPDILPKNVIEGCGMSTTGERTQVYKLDHESDLCLSGTSEMAIAAYLKNKILEEEQLPLKIAAISRCYRAETSSVAEERGIYRVHQFTKVEMFAVTHPNQSDEMLESFREFQEEHFSSLGIHLQTLDMPPSELGASAYRKYDVEAWLPGRNMFGEVSSCSNCTDYQSRRLNIKFKSKNGELCHVHTVNGTALAVPRILIALLETFQNKDDSVSIPDVLQCYYKYDRISKEKRVPELKLKKIKKN